MKSITDKLVQLGAAARRLNGDSDRLNRTIAGIDELLARMTLGIEVLHPRPILEMTSFDSEGKRIIEISYLGYLRLKGRFSLAVKTIRVFESRAASPADAPGSAMPLLEAPRRVRYAAIDVLPDVIHALSLQVEDLAAQMERRCNVAEQVLRELETYFGASSREPGESGSGAALSAAGSAPGAPVPTRWLTPTPHDPPHERGVGPSRTGPAVPDNPRQRRKTHPRGIE